MKEPDYIKQTIDGARNELSGLNEKFASFKRGADRQIDELCEEAGIMGKVQAIRDSVTKHQKATQSRADKLQGIIQALEHIYNRYHLAPIPEGVTHMYGIELASLDPDTRLKVMHGHSDPSWEETITVLGGDPKRENWDGTDPEEPESTSQVMGSYVGDYELT